ncbi:ABC transporter ATP-binding protein [Lederbergia wuyishanensis]|uniref:Sulfonate transport system ATP-binding protein n=1 Tax=Lederbergia wuyishanensis TaxID=1347903 RepID=A0ABU0D7C7_9BACI|nr:ABC transporter ATP-binding protein [Lederbergia wuyishanensis]MCJ8008997.1 ABC transporter ATP-binding protein [Lederbergia wuyishanensis]MDQ0344327.1 sulfonate transport system ATP-binding protein [Lederbergia wuyishanensis]
MLAVQNITRTFNEGKAGFRNVTFSIEEGEIIGILGTSGCGKSTLLRVLSGLDEKYQGRFSFSKQTVGMMFQEPRLMPWLTVKENVYFGVQKGQKKESAKELLELVGLEEFADHYPKDLSGGMAQRTAIARSLITEPNLLLLDEPFSALDAFTKMQLQDLLLSIWQKRKTTMILVTHDIDEALYLCDRIFILRGQPGELYAEIKVQQAKPRSRGDVALAKKKAEILNLLDLNSNTKEVYQ